MALNDVKEIQIPDDRYELLEYIHFNGNDYINTGYTPWNNFGYYLDIQWDQDAVGQYSGHGKITSNNRCYIGSETGGKVAFGTGATASNISNSNTFERHTYQVNTSSTTTNGKFYIDGVQVWSGNSSYVESNRLTMFIGAVNRGTTDYSYCKAKIYNVRFINGVSTATTWTWNLIPVRRKSDGVVGFLKLKQNNTAPDFMTSVNGLLEAGPVIGTPNINVYKIEDSNGNIIWGSQTAFPYRRLEYIHFNGVDEYLDPYVLNKAGYYRYYQFDLERKNVRQMTLAIYDNTLADNLKRYYALDFQPNTYGARGACGNTWSSNYSINNIPLNTKMRCSVVNSTVNSKPRMNFTLVNISSGTATSIIGNTTIDGATNGTLSNQAAYLMAAHNHNSSSDYAEHFTKGKVYYFCERSGNYQGTYTHRLFPAQRKSDEVCGLYDIIDNVFHPIIGTTKTGSAAGPILDEYWDLTVPSGWTEP